MQKLLRSFLDENITIGYCNEKFNYKFGEKSFKKTFDKEFKKFLCLYNSVFYHDNRFVTVFNSYEIRIKEKDLRHLFNLYLYSFNNNLEKEKVVLCEFLYTYFVTINSNEYKTNYQQYKDSQNDFKMILNESYLNKTFFNDFINIIYDFYRQLLKFGIDNDIYIDSEIINRIFNNLHGNESYYNELIDFLVLNKRNLYNVIKFDNNCNIHLEIYFEYIINSLNNFGGYNYAKEIIFELDKSNCLNEKKLKIIINKYIDITNNLCNKLYPKKESFIQGISSIDGLKSELIYLLQNIESFNDLQKEKIRQCLNYLLRLKRYIISDESYVNDDLCERVFKQKISSKKIEDFKKNLLDNKFSLYSASKIRFTSDIGNALESYAKFPMQSLVSMFHIDSQNQIYNIGVEDRVKKNDNFKKYFDEKGKEYTLAHPKLMNKISKDYYEEFLRYLSKTFIIQQNMILSFLGKEDFNKVILELKKSISYTINNNYAIVVCNILSIETNIAKILKNKKMKVAKNGFENLNNLFNIYDDAEKKDGLMYLNYVLYEKSGLNLRNNVMHGTLINSNLDIPLIVSFSGLIFVSWLLNEK